VLVSHLSCFTMVLNCSSLPFQWWSGLRKLCLVLLALLTQVSAQNVENREALALPVFVPLDRLSLIWVAV